MRDALALLRRRPDFARLWVSGLISLLGDWLTYVAVSLIALREGGGAFSVALVLVANMAPHALLAPLAGPLADRLDRRWVMIATNLLRMVLTLAMAAAALAGSVWLLQLLLVLRVSVSAFYIPARRASIARVVERDELLLANTVTSASWSVMFAAGVALGGFLAALVGPTLTILLDAGTFLLATLVILPLPAIRPEGAGDWPGLRVVLRSAGSEMGEAWAYARSRPDLLEATLGKTPLHIVSGATWVVLNLAADEPGAAGAGAIALGLLHGSRAIGTGVGPVVTTWLQARGVPRPVLWSGAAWGTFLVCSAFALSRGHASLLLLFGLFWGMGTGANWVMATARLQALAPDRFQGRLASFDFLCFTLGQCLAALLGGLLIDTGLPWFSSTAAGLVFGVPAWLLLRRAVRRAGDSPGPAG